MEALGAFHQACADALRAFHENVAQLPALPSAAKGGPPPAENGQQDLEEEPLICTQD